MPHLGTQPPTGFKTTTKQSFSGDNSTTAFTLNRASSSNTDLEIFVDNIQQEPTTAYSVSGTTLTFTEAPPTGTNNIYVVNRGGDQNGLLPPQDLGTTDYIFGDDISLNSDGAVVNMGADSEIKITHVADTGIKLTDSGGSPTLQLHDANESVSSDGSNLILTSGGTAFTLPTSDGTSNQALTTNASGALSFSTAKLVGKETIFVPAAAMYPNTTNGCADLAQTELSNGPELKSLDFDKDSDEFAQFTVAFPKSWNEGTVTFQAFFTAATTNTGTTAWGLAGCAIADDDSTNTAFGTVVVATAKAMSGTSNDLAVTAESGAVTIAGSPSTDELVFFQIQRDVSADSLTADAKLLGIKLFFTTDAANDS